MNSFFRFLKRNKLYSTINLLGLSVSMSFVLLLSIYVQKQLNTDSQHKNADRIYVVANEESINSGYYLPKHLKNKFPEIESSSSYYYNGNLELKLDGKPINALTAFVDSSFFDIFSFQIIEGSSTQWKESSQRVMISRSFALSHFGGRNPLGQQISFRPHENDEILTIAGVFEDINNSTFKSVDVYIRGEYASVINSANDEFMSNAGGGVCFIMTYDNSDIKSRESDILSYLKDIFWIYENGTHTKVKLIPLRELYFSQDGAEEYNGGIYFGDISFVKLLSGVCLILLIFAILNYVNMTTALSGFRSKEMATRRLVGGQKRDIFIKMMIESISFCAISMIFAIIIAQFFSPTASKILNYQISIFDAVSIKNIIYILLFILFVGILAGLVPAILIQKTKPIDIVKGTFTLKSKTTYGKIIIIFQNMVTIVMLVMAITMYLQVNHLINAPLGYNTKDILFINNNFGNAEKIAPMLDKLKTLPCVESVGLGEGHPLSGTNNWTIELENGDWVSFQHVKGDSTYFNILGLRKKQDNNIPKKSWLNEYAFKKIGKDESALSFNIKSSSKAQEIGGIYYDFRIGNILNKETACFIYDYGEYPSKKYPWNIIIKTNGEQSSANNSVYEVVKEFYPEKMYEAKYTEDSLSEMFSKEERIVTIIIIFTTISLIVSALGLIAMSSFYMQQERKTVSIKKVFGAKFEEVLKELIFPFIRLVLVAIIIGIPLSYYIVKTWVEGYSYRIDLYWWIFLGAALITISISALAVLWQSLKTAHTNPAETIK